MTDIIDEAANIIAAEEENILHEVRKKAAEFQLGYPGECLECCEESVRLVRGLCAPCRDELGC